MKEYRIYLMANAIEFHCGIHKGATDLHWDYAAEHYDKFLESRWNDSNRSEGDCIESYVRNEVKKLKCYNSVFTRRFEALHNHHDASDLTYSDLREALQNHIDRMDNVPLEHCSPSVFGAPQKTVNSEDLYE